MEPFEQHRTGFGSRRRDTVGLNLRRQLFAWRNRPARIDGDRDAGGFEPGKIDFRHLPAEEGEDFVEGHEPIEIGREGLIDGPVSETEVDGLVAHADLSRISDAVFVGIEKHVMVLRPEPAEYTHIAEILAPAGHRDRDKGKDVIEKLIPYGELVGSGRHVGNGEGAVRVTGCGIQAIARAAQLHFVQPHPAAGQRVALVHGVVRRPGHVRIDDTA